MVCVRRERRERAKRLGWEFNSFAAVLMRSRVAWGMERPGTSLRTTETVAGLRPRYFASVLRLMGPSIGCRFRFIETQSACGRCSADAIRRGISPSFSWLHRNAEYIALGK